MSNEAISIVLIHWKIRKGSEAEFERKWKTEFVVRNREGLIGEFLSRVERRDSAYPYITWPILCDNLAHEEQCTHYINVGLWSSHPRFFEEVGQYMKDDRPISEFEIERRRRVALAPAEWRRGPADLPKDDSPGTR
jgi:hypothetical protein